MARKKAPQYVTPRGVFRWPRLNEPDREFDADGTYSVDVALEEKPAASMIELLKPMYDAQISASKKERGKKKLTANDPPWKPGLDDEGDEDGTTVFRFKMKAHVKTKEGKEWDQRPALFDAAGNKLEDVKVGGGSEGKVSFSVSPYLTPKGEAGITLRLRACQILELVEWTGGTAEGYGFETEEGGYVAESDEPLQGAQVGDGDGDEEEF